MVISNVGFYPYKTELFVREILQRGDPHFFPPYHWTCWTYWIPVLQKNRTVAYRSAPLLPPLLSIVSIFFNIGWFISNFIHVYRERCPTLRMYPDPTPTVNEEINLYLNTIRQRIIRFDTK